MVLSRTEKWGVKRWFLGLKTMGYRPVRVVCLAWGAIFLALILVTTSASAARNPLLEVLIRKGILTPQEANQVEREALDLEREKAKQVEKQVKEEVKEKVEKAEKRVEKKAAKAAESYLPKALKGLSVNFKGYVDYSLGDRSQPEWSPPSRRRLEHTSFNDIRLTRGYITIKNKLTPWLYARATSDVHQDTGGNWELRMKYYYAELRPPNLGFLTDMKSEIGMGHMPWLDFEEHINPYRCQETMAIERAGIFNSADLGISLRGYFGGRVPDSKAVLGETHYDGFYGSWHFGVYNGPGYHNSELNDNKVVEYRVTVRPLPHYRWLAGLQLSYFGLYGKGANSSSSGTVAGSAGSPRATRDALGNPMWKEQDYFSDWVVHLAMLSYQNPWLILTGQYYAAKGGQEGTRVTPTGAGLWGQGFSFFGNVKFPWWERRLNLFARYDYYDVDKDNEVYASAMYQKWITGLAYEIYKKNLILLAFETTRYGRQIARWPSFHGTRGYLASPVSNANQTALGDDYRVQLVYQIGF